MHVEGIERKEFKTCKKLAKVLMARIWKFQGDNKTNKKTKIEILDYTFGLGRPKQG